MVKTEKVQNPKAVDTAIGWLILAGGGMVLLPILSRNIPPYQDTLMALAPAVIRWVMRLPLIGWSVGALAFAAIQAAEVWPLLSEETPEEERSAEWRKALSGRWLLATMAYGIDAFMCIRFWPVLVPGVSVQMLIVGFNTSMISWPNLAQTLLTLFGCAMFILLYRFVRRVA